LKKLEEELVLNFKDEVKYQIGDIYEVLNFDKNYLQNLSQKRLYIKDFLDIFEDLEKDYHENYELLTFQFLNNNQNNDDNIDFIQQNLKNFIKNSKILLKKFFMVNKISDQESSEKKILKESIKIFLQNLEKEFLNSLNEIIEEFEKYQNNKENKEKEKNEENSYSNIFISNLKNTESEICDNNESVPNLFEKAQNRKTFEQKHRREINIIQIYLQKFVFKKNFIVYLSNIVSFFYGIKSNIFIDKQENITLDFHSDIPQFKSLANDFNYLLHLKIMIRTNIINYEIEEDSVTEEKMDIKKNDEENPNDLNEVNIIDLNEENKLIKKKLQHEVENKKYTTKYYDEKLNNIVYVYSIKDKNLIPFYKINQEDITLHPPHLEFNLENDKFYRNYNEKDEFFPNKQNEDIEIDFEKKDSIDKSNITDNVYFEDNDLNKDKLNSLLNKSIIKKSLRRFSSFINKKDSAPQEKLLIRSFIQPTSGIENNNLLENPFLNVLLKNKQTETSIFRNIDKLRLIKMSLNLVFDFGVLNDYSEFITYQIIRNEKAYKEQIKFRNILGSYLDIFNNENIIKTNEIMRNFYGEKVAYYFYFASHYISWLIFPSILGIIFIILEQVFYIFNIFQMKDFSNEKDIEDSNIGIRVYYVYIYLFFIIIWAVMNVKSLVSKQKYFNYCWGMDGTFVDSKIKTENIEKAIVTMGIQMPIKNKRKLLFTKMIVILVSLLLIIFTIFMNFILFELSRIKVFNDDQSNEMDNVISASIKIFAREINDFDIKQSNMKKTNNSLIDKYLISSFISKNEHQLRIEKKILFHPESNKINEASNEKSNIEKNKNKKNTSVVNSKESNLNKKNIEKEINKKKLQENLKKHFDIFSYDRNKLNKIQNTTNIEYPNKNNSINKGNYSTNNSNPNGINSTNDDRIEIIDIEHIKLKPTFWFHLIPIFSVLLRRFMSKVNHSTAKWMIDLERHTEENTYEDSFLVKMICYEFVNYYFYLYYIIFYKQYNKLCAGNNCYKELGMQLTTIIITSTLLNFIELLYPYITIMKRKYFSNKNKDKYKKNIKNENEINDDILKIEDKMKNKENQHTDHRKLFNIKENENDKNPANENPRNKYYDRVEYYDIMTNEYMELIMNFGYIILFGISSPMCFFIALVYAIVERFTDALKFTQSHNVNIIGNFFFIF